MSTFLHATPENAPISEKPNYKELILKLPKVHHLSTCTDLYQYKGFWYPLIILEGIMSVQQHFKPQPSDIFLCSAPKAGSTWLKALAFSIQTRTQFDEETNPLFHNLPHVLLPFLEINLAENPSNRDPQLPLLSTHLPYNALPESIIASGCKLIYICREPKDTFISLWYYMQKTMNKDMEGLNLFSFEEEFELFCEGKSVWGPYWDHILGYFRASLDKPETILFLRYEDVKKDPLCYVIRMAEFMGKPFSKEEENEGVPQKIIELCSFENLRNLEVNKSGKHRPIGPFEIDNSSYFRKGICGDWKNHLTLEMEVIMDQITKQKLEGSGVVFGTES